PAELADELEVAEHLRVTFRILLEWAPFAELGGRDGSHRHDHLDGGQQSPHQRGLLRIRTGQPLQVDGLSRLDSIPDRGGPFHDERVLAPLIRVIAELVRRAHRGHSTDSSSISFRSRSSARKWRTLAAFSVIPSTAATSAKGRSSR